MRHSPQPWRTRTLVAACLGWAALGACSTEEVQLESMAVMSGPNADGPELRHGGDLGGAACISFVDAAQLTRAHEIRLNGKPLLFNLPYDERLQIGGHGGGGPLFCVEAGDYDLSLVSKGKTRAHTGVLSFRGDSQHVFIIEGDPRAPTLRHAEIDLSAPSTDFSLRRIRITNLAKEQKPVQLVYYNSDREQIGLSERVSYGETWTGTISAEVTGWNVAPSTSFPPPIYAGQGSGRNWDYYCREVPPTGIVILSAQLMENASITGAGYRMEYITQRLETCTVNRELCPVGAPCFTQGW